MADLRLYFSNIGLWLKQFPVYFWWVKDDPLDFSAWNRLILYHGLDVGVNTFTGGDPRISLSLRFQRDRRQNVISRALRWIADTIFHPEGVDESYWKDWGDDTEDNRELSGFGQFVSTLLFLGILIGVML